MKRFYLSLRVILALLPLLPTTTWAGIPEPDIIFFGRVYGAGVVQTGDVNASPAPITAGTLVWTIQPAAGPSFQVTSQLTPLGSSGFIYRLAIPVSRGVTGSAAEANTVSAGNTPASIGRAAVTLDGEPLFITGQAGPSASSFSFQMTARGYIERVDLATAAHLGDWDGDGIPDPVEEQYPSLMNGGVNKITVDSHLDLDDDGADNLDEYLDGGDLYGYTYAQFVLMHGLFGTNAIFEADPDLDGFANGMEFALGGDPNESDGPRQLARLRMRMDGGPAQQPQYSLDKPFPEAPRSNGIVYALRFGHSLGNLTGTGLVVSENSDSMLQAHLGGTTQGSGFFQLHVEPAPAP